MKRDVSADGGALWRTRCAAVALHLAVGPAPICKWRVVWATVLLFGAKLATVAVPFTFKWAVDALTGQGSAPVAAGRLAGLGVRRADRADARLRRHAHPDGAADAGCATACSPRWRCTRCAGSRIRTFEHMHQLSLRFHLERKTGGLTRVLERGRNGIETIVRMVILQLVPTIVEFALIVGVLLYQFDWRYVRRRSLVTVALYMWFTYQRDRVAHRDPPRHERQRHRRQHQGDRLAAQLRDGEVFRRRGARGRSATTARWRATSAPASRPTPRSRLLNAGQARDLHHRARRRHGDVRATASGRAPTRSAISS